ncbi:hypothetical protein AYK20_02870 [Thermoplasmatales archaeon SG8-52-1]|nr:MAG: hypothetical protein AYK20_02870 [Thermoplasmatales archaeon SG8-52-1]
MHTLLEILQGRKYIQNNEKDELIQIHMFLLHLKTHLENIVDNNGGDEFQTYNKLDIAPYHVYKSKREHKLAIFTLSEGIGLLLSNNKCPGLEKISYRLSQMTKLIMTDKEKERIIF